MEFKKLEHMLELQDQVNSLISNEWRANNNPWYRAIWLESNVVPLIRPLNSVL